MWGSDGREKTFQTEPLILQPLHCCQMEPSCCPNHVSSTDGGVATISNAIKHGKHKTTVTSICGVLIEVFKRSEPPLKRMFWNITSFLGKGACCVKALEAQASLHLLFFVVPDNVRFVWNKLLDWMLWEDEACVHFASGTHTHTHTAFSLYVTVMWAELDHTATLNSSPLPFSTGQTSTFTEEHVLPRSFWAMLRLFFVNC